MPASDTGSAPDDMVLVACPLCGGCAGYTLRPGSTHRWQSVCCASCGQEVTEARSSYPPENALRTASADVAWNDAGAYADKLRQDAERFRILCGQFSVMSLNIDGNHSWVWRGNPGNLKGPTLEAAVDALRTASTPQAAAIESQPSNPSTSTLQ